MGVSNVKVIHETIEFVMRAVAGIESFVLSGSIVLIARKEINTQGDIVRPVVQEGSIGAEHKRGNIVAGIFAKLIVCVKFQPGIPQAFCSVKAKCLREAYR